MERAGLPIGYLVSILAFLATSVAYISIVKVEWHFAERRDPFRIRFVEEAQLAVVLNKLLLFLFGPILFFRLCDIEADDARGTQHTQGPSAPRLTRLFECIEVVEDRNIAKLLTPRSPTLFGWKWLALANYRIHKDFVTFRAVVIRGLLDPRLDPLPFLELLLITDETKWNGEKANELTICLHSGDTRGLDMLSARRRIGLAEN
jgi:hypothetical protein